jgi:hypothetical protein
MPPSIVLMARALVTATLTCSLAGPMASQQPPTPAPVPRPWLATITLNGFAEASWSYNANRPPSRLNQLRVFDFDDRKFKIDNAELVLQRAVAKPNDFGFRIDAVTGTSVPRLSAAAGLFRDANGKAGNFDLQQLFVSYVVPVGSGLRIDAGKWLTHIANEGIPGYDGYFDNATRSVLLGYGAPTTHTGIKTTYMLSSAWTAMFEVIEGWDVWKDNNSVKSFGAQVAITPVDGVAVFVNGIVGPERTDNNHDGRALGNLIATWKLSPSMSLALDALLATEKNAAGPGDDATWASTVFYARNTITKRFAVILRGERFDDSSDGVRTGTRQTLLEGTVTPEFKITNNFVARCDLRLDHSTARVFESRTGNLSSQPTVLLNVLARF